MLTRYAGAIGAGAVVTAALIYWMQQLIAEGEIPVLARTEPPVLLARIDFPPEVATVVRDPPPPPDAAPVQPRVDVQIGKTTDRAQLDIGTRSPRAPGFRDGPEGLRITGEHGFGPGSTEGEMLPTMQATPVYPHTAEVRGLEGQVAVEFTVLPDGRVADARVIESTHPVFEKTALDAALRSRYQPRIVDGRPITVTGVRKLFEFRLEN